MAKPKGEGGLSRVKVRREYSPGHPSIGAIKRVTDPLPIPTSCNECGSKRVSWVKNDVVYRQLFGEWPWIYLCGDCGAYVGMHPYTNIPLGTLAGKKLREARQRAKAPFEKIWQSKFIDRSMAYAALAQHMQISPSRCHFGMFDQVQCVKAETWAKETLKRFNSS